MAGKTYSGTYTSTILLTDPATQNPVTLTGSVTASGTNAASESGIYSSAAYAWSVTNLGRITAHGAESYGIALLDGGTVVNGAPGTLATIVSDETGILITGAPSNISNFGTIVGTAGRGVFLEAGGSLTNAAGATIEGGFEGVAIYNANANLTNAGTIYDTGAAGIGVELYAGTAINDAGARITGYYGVSFVARSATGTLTNAGLITATGRDGVSFTGGGNLTNSGTVEAALAGVLAIDATATIANTSSIGGAYAGIDLLAGGAVNNEGGGRITGQFGVTAAAPATVTNAGTIAASLYQGVSLNQGGTLTNAGSLSGIDAGAAAFYGAATIVNSGTITSTGDGISLAEGGSLTNQLTGLISAGIGIVLQNGPITGATGTAQTLSNAGRIEASGFAGVELLTDTAFTNASTGLVSGGKYGVYTETTAGTIANYGLITGQTGLYAREVLANGSLYPGQLTLINGGTITGTAGTAVSLFSSRDLLKDLPGAVFNGAIIGGGATLELAAGAAGTLGSVAASLASFSTVIADPGAQWSVTGTIAAHETLEVGGTVFVVAGQTLDIAGIAKGEAASSGTIGLLGSAALDLTGTLQSTVTLAFDAPSGRLELTSPLTDSAKTNGFSATDTIWLPTIADTGLTKTFSNNTLLVKQNGIKVAQLTLLGSYTANSFAFSADPGGGTDITIPCFLAGTRIATESGEVRVERLRAGMRVLTASGAFRPIVWTGARRVTVAGHAAPETVRPVRILADAFGPGLPHRTLFLSPDHCIAWEGALIPAASLIDRHAIDWADLAEARYIHIELETHDVLLAEGLPAESFYFTGNTELLGEPRPERKAGRRCLPLVLEGGPWRGRGGI